MAKVFFLSNHQVLNDLYQTNFRVYLGCELEIFKKISDFEVALERESCDAVISLSYLNDEDCAVKVKKALDHLGLDVPLFVIGEKSSVVPGEKVHIFEGNLNVSSILSRCAQVLGITAQDMAAKKVGDYYSFSVRNLRVLETAPVDLFIKVADGEEASYSLCMEKDGHIESLAADYARRGISEIFVLSRDRLIVTGALTKALSAKLDENDLSIDEKVDVLDSAFDDVARQLSDNEEVTKELTSLSLKCVDTLQSVSSQGAGVGKLLQGLLDNQAGYLFTHTVLASYISKHVINNVSWGVEEHIEKINFILFFHDLFLVPIFERYPNIEMEEDFIFNSEVSDKDKSTVLNHANDIAQVIKKFPKCPIGADAILMQHHGTTNGIGFTIDYKDEISPLAKVIIVSEAYVEEYMAAKKRDPNAKVHEYILEKLEAKFKKHTYRKIIKTLETLTL